MLAKQFFCFTNLIASVTADTIRPFRDFRPKESIA